MDQISFRTGDFSVKIYNDNGQTFTDIEVSDDLGFSQMLWYLTGEDIIENTFIAMERIIQKTNGKLEPIIWNKN